MAQSVVRFRIYACDKAARSAGSGPFEQEFTKAIGGVLKNHFELRKRSKLRSGPTWRRSLPGMVAGFAKQTHDTARSLLRSMAGHRHKGKFETRRDVAGLGQLRRLSSCGRLTGA